jgi:hypothetical protein
VQVVESTCGGRGRVAQRQRGADVRSSHKCCAWCGAVLCMVWAGGCSCVQLCRCVCVCVCVCVCWCVWACLRPRHPGARAAAGRIAACAVPQAGCGMAVGCVGCVCVCVSACVCRCVLVSAWCMCMCTSQVNASSNPRGGGPRRAAGPSLCLILMWAGAWGQAYVWSQW